MMMYPESKPCGNRHRRQRIGVYGMRLEQLYKDRAGDRRYLGAGSDRRLCAIGEQADSAELCYLLTGTQDAAKAVPAYRWQNRFVSAADGTVLQ